MKRPLAALLASALASGASAVYAAPPSFAVVDTSVDESAGNVTVHIAKTGVARTYSKLNFVTGGGNATAGADYSSRSGTVTIGTNQTDVTISVPILDDQLVEGDENFGVSIRAIRNAIITHQGTVTIKDNDKPPPPATQTCPDGSVIPASEVCPVPIPPPSGDIMSPSLSGLPPIASEFDFNLSLQAAWGTGAIPPSAAPDVVGALRFICGAGQILKDDPIVYPGQPGKSHWHQFYGNDKANAYSTYESLRTSGQSTCNYGTYAGNRSGYWQPAMEDGKGNFVNPDYVVIYYKRRPASDPIVSDPANPQYMGHALPLPNGLRFIFGYDMLTSKAATGGMYFNCDGPGATGGHYPNIPAAMPYCPAGARIGFIVNAPQCWDGIRLDSANHRDHVAYPGYGSWGYLKCPATHPYVIPGFTLGAWYTIAAGDDLSLWHFSSDDMHPELAHGTTGHADWFGAWDQNVLNMWQQNDIDKMLNASGGDLGNGKQLKGASQPLYDGVPSWTVSPRLVPIPTGGM